jgi:hypothetical protein
LPEAVEQGDDDGGAAADGEPLEDDRDGEEYSEQSDRDLIHGPSRRTREGA